MAFAEDYVQVNERIVAFKAQYPEGSLQSEIVRLDDTIAVVKAYAYRTPDDIRPGIGFSSLGIPGKTPYTKGSELENCETSAWGRALAALGFEVKRGIATQNEIDSKKEPGRGLTAATSPAETNKTPLDEAEGKALGSAFTRIVPGRMDEARAAYAKHIKTLGFKDHATFQAGGHGLVAKVMEFMAQFEKEKVA